MFMKPTLRFGLALSTVLALLAGLLLPAAPASAETAGAAAIYYVSPEGNDANSGASEAAPFRTIQRCAEAAQPGDTCLIASGTYRETVTPANSGTADKPIVFRAAPGATVIVSGSEPVSGWQQHNGNVYVTDLPWSLGHENQLFVVDGADITPLWEARWPNISEYSLPALQQGVGVASGGSAITLTDPDLTQPDDYWKGATIWERGGDAYVGKTSKVTGFHSATHTLTYEAQAGNYDYMWPKAGSTYYLMGILGELDAPHEWYVDAAAKKVYLWAPDGGVPSNVEVKKRHTAFNLNNKSYIHLSGLQVFAANIPMNNAHRNVLDGLKVLYPYFSNYSQGTSIPHQLTGGINVAGTYNEIKNSTIAYSTGTLVNLDGSHNRLVNNHIHDGSYMAAYDPLVKLSSGDDNLISHNSLHDSGRFILYWRMGNGEIAYNDIYNGMWLSRDGAQIYSWGTDMGNTEIHHNWIHDSQGTDMSVGLYFDNFTQNSVVHHNVIFENDVGIQLNTPGNYHLIYNNTVADNLGGIGYWGSAPYDKELYGTRVFNNIFTDKVSLTADTTSGYNTLTEAGINFANPAANDYRLTEGSTAINSGAVIPGITDGYVGAAPDVGAYEFGGEEWTAGHDFANPPAAALTPIETPYMNKVRNSGFGWGVDSYWTVRPTGSASILQVSNSGSAASKRGFQSKLQLAGGGGVEQLIEGLKPNTDYILTGWMYNDPNHTVSLSVKDYGGTERVVAANETEYVRKTITFRTGAADTTALVQVVQGSPATGFSYADDIGVYEATPFDPGVSQTLLDTVQLASPTLIYTEGEQATLTLTGKLRNGAAADFTAASLEFSSSDDSVLRFDGATGSAAAFTALSEGQVTVTAKVTMDGITRATTAVVTVFPDVPPPVGTDWSVRHYGPASRGFATVDGSELSLVGMGENVWNVSDDFVYLSKSFEVDANNPEVTLTATIDSFSAADPASIGLMIRDRDTADSKHVHFRLDGNGQVMRYVFRNEESILDAQKPPAQQKYWGSQTGLLMDYAGKSMIAPFKLKLVKQGNTVAGYYWKNQTWMYMGKTTVEFTGNTFLAGIGMYTGKDKPPAKAVISDLSVTMGPITTLPPADPNDPTDPTDPDPTPKPPGYKNVAAGRTTITSSLPMNTSRLTDGNFESFANIDTAGPQWVVIDLGASYKLDTIKLWHYYADNRVYRDVIAQVSNDPTFAAHTTVFNNDKDNSAGQGAGTNDEYVETADGKTIRFDPVDARYVRLWTNGSNKNVAHHYVEAEVYGSPLAAPKPPGYANQALNRTQITSSAPINAVRLTDGDKTNYTGMDAAGPQWVKIDLGQSYSLDAIKLWHYFADGRKYRDVIVQVSNDPTFATYTNVFNNDKDNTAGQGEGTHEEYAESADGKTFEFAPVSARYVRLWTNGSDKNTSHHYVEVEAWGAPVVQPKPPGYANQALGKTDIASSKPINPVRLTDGDKSAGAYTGMDAEGPQWVRIDLGQNHSLDAIKLWHYYADGRTYRDVIVQLSSDPSFATHTTVFNNDTDNSAGQGKGGDAEYAESADGKTIEFAATTARYIRLWTNGSSRNASHHYVEVEAWGVPIDETAPATTATVDSEPTNGWHRADATVTLTATDSLSGVEETQVRLGADGAWARYAQPIVLTEEGVHEVWYRSSDKAGNVEPEKSIVVRIDKTAPAFRLTAGDRALSDGDSFEELLPLGFSAWDDGSGLAAVGLTVDGVEVSVDPLAPQAVIDLVGRPGSHTATVLLEDAAGNRQEVSIAFAVTTSLDSMSALMDRFEQAGELTGPLSAQLANNLDQARHHLDQGRTEQAAKHLEDFIKHMTNPALASHVGAAAQAVLQADAEFLIGAWT